MDRSYGSFNLVKEDRYDSEKPRDKSGLPQLFPSVSFNDKIVNAPSSGPQPQRKKSVVYRISFKRKSVDGEETNELCKYTTFLYFFYAFSF